MATSIAADEWPSVPGGCTPHEGPNAATRLLPHIYAELRSLAALYLRNERPGHTLQPTALVHEAFLRLGTHIGDASDPTRVLAVASTSMRRVLIDHARRRGALKRGGGRRQDASAAAAAVAQRTADVLAVHEAIDGLLAAHERAARVAQLRFFGGLTLDEAASLLGVSRKTASEDWRFARAWLSRALANEGGPG